MKVCGMYRSLHQHCAALLKRDKVFSQGRKQWWMCLCHIPLFLLCVCLREKKRGRSHTAELIVCGTTGQNLIVRLLSRWAAGVIGLSSRLPCPRAPRMTLLTVGGSEEPNTGSASIAGMGERPNICLKRKRGGRKRDLFEQKQLETPHLLFALDWRSCSVPNNRSLSL